MIDLSDKQKQEKVEKLQAKIQELLKEADMVLMPVIHITSRGIYPALVFEETSKAFTYERDGTTENKA